jgi:putative hydrolase of the HAD superfamily
MTSVHEGLLIDIGGVLTTDVIAAFDEFCAREGLSGISIRDLYYNSAEAQRLFHRLELGEVDAVEAQPQLASILGLPETRSDNLFRDAARPPDARLRRDHHPCRRRRSDRAHGTMAARA